jgi:hypothetical protein
MKKRLKERKNIEKKIKTIKNGKKQTINGGGGSHKTIKTCRKKDLSNKTIQHGKEWGNEKSVTSSARQKALIRSQEQVAYGAEVIGFPDGDVKLFHFGGQVDGCHQDLFGMVVHH